MADTNGSTVGRSVISKVVAILRRLEVGGSQTATELSHSTEIPLSTAHRIVGELTAWQVLQRGADGRYELASIIGGPAPAALNPQSLLTASAATMVDLAAVTRRDVRFGYLDDTRVRYAEQACGPQPIAPFTQAATLPAHATAIGHVLLAFSPPAVVSSITNHGLAPYTPFTPTTAMTLGRALSVVRLHGVAVVSGQLSPDHAAAAAPVFGPGRSIVAALEVRLHDVVEELRGVVPALTVAARGLSRELAHIPVDNANSIGTVSSLGRECTRTA